MADPIALTSGLITLVTFALQSSVVLFKTVDSFQTHPRTVRDLRDETDSLKTVLQSLSETVANDTEIDIQALKLPLLQCGKACKEFEEKIARCTQHSNGSRTSIRDWAKLTYMGGSITEFRNMLAGYKSTINIALAAANLRKSAVTPAVLQQYKLMIKEATADLEEHLIQINDNLESIPSQGSTVSGEGKDERRQMEEEKLSTEQCLGICAQLSAQIDQIKPSPIERPGGAATMIILPERITTNALQNCKEKLNDAATLLNDHRQNIEDRLKRKLGTTSPSEEDAAELASLQDQRESLGQCIEICSKASKEVEAERINIIEDVNAPNDSCQMLVSTIGELIWAKRVSSGERSIQIIGQTSDATIQQVSGDHHSRLVPVPKDAVEQKSAEISGFRDRFGAGYKLSQPNQSRKSSPTM